MPFSALTPEGPVSLLGADAQTVERMRRRGREEGCFSAKCCGAPMVVRTAQGRAAHFMHKVVPTGCDGDRGETPEHRRLKQLIATEVERSEEWSAETEAVHRDAASGQVLWRADVLAMRRQAKVAFEVQLSNADYEQMRLRQDRYRATGVRGLWFVRTKKGFPVAKELPIFPVESDEDGDWVSLARAWDWPFIGPQEDGAGHVELTAFVRAALDKRLKWAPLEDAPDTELSVYVEYAPGAACPGCGRLVAGHYCVGAFVPHLASYPEFQFARVGGFRRRPNWYQPMLQAVWSRVREQVNVTLRSDAGACSWCSGPLAEAAPTGAQKPAERLSCTVQLKDLPAPRFGTVERDWLRRWAVLDA